MTITIRYDPEKLREISDTAQQKLREIVAELERRGVSVVSANTDGIVLRTPVAHPGMQSGAKTWPVLRASNAPAWYQKFNRKRSP